MNPASVMKLVTTYAALELLGPAYRWKTEVYAATANDLVLKGYGDPKLNSRASGCCCARCAAAGLREIRGDLVLDRSYFAPRADGALRRRRLPALQRRARRAAGELQVAALQLPPGASAARCACSPSRACPASRSSTRCGSPRAPAPRAARSASCIQAELPVRGRRAPRSPAPYPAELRRARAQRRAATQPEDYVAGMIRQLWTEMGGTLERQVREGAVPPAARAGLHARVRAARRDRARHQQVLQQRDGAPALPHARRRAAAARRRGPRQPLAAIAQWLAAKRHQGARAGDGERLGPVAHRAHQRRAASARCCRRHGAAR